MFKISVFGGSAPKPGEPVYESAYQLGTLLGAAGYTVLNGGYIGTMEAVSRGTAESGGHVIGITCDEIEAWRPVTPNRWVQEERRFATLRQRLHTLTEECDAAIALPGGAGTLTEIVLMWTLMQTAVLPARPLILVGAGWRDTFQTLFKTQAEYILPHHRAQLSFAPDSPSAFRMLQEMLAAGA